MAKKSNRPAAKKLNWQEFNFLENLLIFCAVKERCAPPESGVKFGISGKPQTLCILFHIDRETAPLIPDEGVPRPDYLAFYVGKDSCICTIIEMKGKDQGRLEHGIEQIKMLRDRLKQEIRSHLPHFNVYFQGILLCPPGANIPNPKLEKEKSQGFIIVPLQYNYKFELFPYVSKRNVYGERYKPEQLRSVEAGFVEQTLSEKALPKRKRDSFYHANYLPGLPREGIYINYGLSDDGEYLVLKTDKSLAQVVIRGDAQHLEHILDELNTIGVSTKRKFVFNTIDS